MSPWFGKAVILASSIVMVISGRRMGSGAAE